MAEQLAPVMAGVFFVRKNSGVAGDDLPFALHEACVLRYDSRTP